MRKIVLALTICGGLWLVAAQEKQANQKSNTPAQPATGHAAPPVLTIPPGAKQIEPYTYRYTDAQGKTWIYRQTPFGVSRHEETNAVEAPVPESQPVIVHDKGDSYEFITTSPFGEKRWTRKKTELNSDEQQMLQRTAQSAAPADKTPGSKVDSKQEKR